MTNLLLQNKSLFLWQFLSMEHENTLSLLFYLNGTERANLINVCLQQIWDAGAKVVSVTCNGWNFMPF